MWSVTATDMSAPALDVATQNAAAHDCNNITFCEGSWFDAVSHQKFNLIISNPPYIAEHDENLKGDIRHEPTTALTSGADGLDDIKHIVKLAPTFLEKNGTLILEHGFDQGDAVAAWLKQAGFENVGHQKDIQGIVRITFGQLAQNG
jgi:release factor glutamine methyltransferase